MIEYGSARAVFTGLSTVFGLNPLGTIGEVDGGGLVFTTDSAPNVKALFILIICYLYGSTQV